MARSHSLPGSVILAVFTALFAFMATVEASRADDRAMMLPVDPAPLVAETTAGERAFTIEIADDAQKRGAGLMFRESMEDDHGMLFVFDEARPVGFWMKNTPMPLDLLYIGDDGRVKEIHYGEPFSEAPIESRVPIRFVLELKRGTAERTGIGTGDLLRHPLISRASKGG